MGMSDQYDDGRYDGGDVHNAMIERMAATSIGYVPITARRGGIKYPTSKGTPVATTPKKLTPKQKVRKLEAELDSNLTLQQTLAQEEGRLRADIRKYDIPDEPPARHDMFRVAVQFSARGPQYSYLLTRSGGRWFTTGTKEEHKVFPSWAALCEWLNGTYWHSRLDVLGVDLERAYPTERTDEPPF